ncbi:hypothetical protein ACFQ0D_32835, partial [Micromonospora zhanjiangensis]
MARPSRPCPGPAVRTPEPPTAGTRRLTPRPRRGRRDVRPEETITLTREPGRRLTAALAFAAALLA